MWLTGPVAPWHVGSSQTRARTRVPCIGRQILNHCATREAPFIAFYDRINLPYYGYIPGFVYGPLDYFHFLVIIYNAAVKIDVQIFAQTYVFISLGVELLGHVITLCLTF